MIVFEQLKKVLCISLLFAGGIAAAQQKIYVNEMSGNDKWLELYNAEESAVDIGGYQIQKLGKNGNPDSEGDFIIPAGTTIPAKGFRYWAQVGEDIDPDIAILPWGISPTKDISFVLYDKDGNQLDRFDVRSEDLKSRGNKKTVGRKTDGDPELIIFANRGTKGFSNNMATVYVVLGNPRKVFINEINGNVNQKWLEIYNDEDEAVSISDYRIQKIDEFGVVDSSPFVIKKTIIPAKDFLYWAREGTEGQEEAIALLPWGISARKDVSFRLWDDDNRLLDFFEVKMDDGMNSEGGRAVGRKTDGASELVLFSNNGTQGTSNNAGSISGMDEARTDIMSGYIQSGILVLLGDNITDVAVYNLAGSLLLSEEVSGIQRLDVGYLPKGAYILKLANREVVKVQKVVKN